MAVNSQDVLSLFQQMLNTSRINYEAFCGLNDDEIEAYNEIIEENANNIVVGLDESSNTVDDTTSIDIRVPERNQFVITSTPRGNFSFNYFNSLSNNFGDVFVSNNVTPSEKFFCPKCNASFRDAETAEKCSLRQLVEPIFKKNDVVCVKGTATPLKVIEVIYLDCYQGNSKDWHKSFIKTLDETNHKVHEYINTDLFLVEKAKEEIHVEIKKPIVRNIEF